MNTRLLPAGLILAAITLPLSVAVTAGIPAPSLPKNEIKRGLAIAPVPLRFKPSKKEQVARGSYIVNAQSGCNDCHTDPSYAKGGDPFAGEKEQINTANYLAGGREFGPFTSANITPDANGLPAGMTEAQFIQTLRTGHSPGQERLLQVMPWPVFGKMTDKDLKAVYAYLSAIPHAEPAN
jgi:mono/diheme cytochrome c family protein